MQRALVLGLPLLALGACSAQPPKVSPARTTSAQARSAACAPSQLAFSLDNGNGRFNGMSHSGTTLMLRNIGTSACTIPTQPLPTFTDANKQALNIAVQESPGFRPESTPITLAPGVTVGSDMRWVSGDVYDHGHCESPAIVTLSLGKHTVATDFTEHLCGPAGQAASYTLTPFKPSTATAAAAGAKTLTYTCNDGRTVQAVYPDTDTAVLLFDGQTHRLHIGISADGARYANTHWQWWTKGMREGRLAQLKPGESIASARGVSCMAR